jgi:O-antigen/teichoic acid export membrane protein
VYGDQWLQAIPVAQVLCIACCVELPHMLSREALLAVGEVRRASALQVQLVFAQVVGLVAVIPYGLIGAGIGLLVAAGAGLFITQRQVWPSIGVRFVDMVRCCKQSAYLSAFSLTPLAIAVWWVPIDHRNYVIYGVLGGLSVSALWLVGLRLLGHPLWDEVSKPLAQLGSRIGWIRA